MLRDLFSLFPAYAGVIPYANYKAVFFKTFPRIRGGDPHETGEVIRGALFSPHMRG